MDNKKSGESRRKLLKSIAAGSGVVIAGKSLPESWARPVVDSVLLPAHAQTSNAIFSSSSITITSLEQKNNTLFAGIMDSLVPAVHAIEHSFAGCAMIVGDNVDFWLQTLFGSVLTDEYTAVLPLSGAEVNITYSNPCVGVIEAVTGTGAVDAATAAYIDIRLIHPWVNLGQPTVYRFPVAGVCVSKTIYEGGC